MNPRHCFIANLPNQPGRADKRIYRLPTRNGISIPGGGQAKTLTLPAYQFHLSEPVPHSVIRVSLEQSTLEMKLKLATAAAQKILFLPHAIKQMSRPDRMITTEEVRQAVLLGEIIEEYPEDPRGESCLVLHTTKNRSIHVVCAPKTEYLAVITAYIPSPGQWSPDFKMRK